MRGYEADFTIIDRDIFHIPVEELKDIQAITVVIDGKIVHQK